MIKFEERKSKNQPGKTSFYISFNFDKNIINIIKSSKYYHYHSKEKLWEVPISSLSYLIDNLTYFDDIQLFLCNEEKSVKYARKPVLNYKLKPFKYQLDGIEYGLNHDKWLLLDEPGLGKTKQLIHIAEELKVQDNIKHCLIVCGINILKSNWKREIEKHSNESCMILGEKISKKGRVSYMSTKEKVEQLLNPIEEFFIITNIETLRNDDIIKALNKNPNEIGMILVDEVHKCKSTSSQQGSNLLKLKKFKYKIAATGTLLLNNPLDTYVPLKFIDEENCSFTDFKNYYCLFDGPFNGMVTGYRNLNQLKNHIQECSLRRTKDEKELDLPPKNIYNEFIDMNDEHRKFYDIIKSGIKQDIMKEVDKVKISTSSLLAMVTRLRQATACPNILTTNNIISSKIERCVDLVDEILSNPNEKIVIFSTFKQTVYELAKLLNQYNPLIVTGDSKEQEISEAMEKFQSNEENRIWIGTWQKAGTGITLTAASYMIFLDTPWTSAVFDQACDRIHRIGAKKSVFIYNLICKDTIDERVCQLLKTKKALGQFILNDEDGLDEEAFEDLRKYIVEEL